jgi:hypothetical protein
MTFGDRVVGALKLDAKTFEDIERDPTAMGQAVAIIAVAALAGNLGQIWRLGFGVMIVGVCSSLVAYVLWAVIVWLAGTKLMPDPATKADFPETFRTVAFAAAPGLLGAVTIVPLLGWILMFVIWPIILLWSMAAMVIAVRQVLDYTETFKAVIVVLIGFAVYLIFRTTIAVLWAGATLMSGILGP